MLCLDLFYVLGINTVMYKRGGCMKCKKCKKDFDRSQLTTARQADGQYASGNVYYCSTCEEEIYQRNLLVDYMDRLFIYKGYYKDLKVDKSKINKSSRNRLMVLVNSQIKNLRDNAYSYKQIRIILDYMLTRENVEFSDSILGLVPYYYVKTGKHYNELARIASRKSYGSIPAPNESRLTKPAHKPKPIDIITVDML